jgi:hypothetical protein
MDGHVRAAAVPTVGRTKSSTDIATRAPCLGGPPSTKREASEALPGQWGRAIASGRSAISRPGASAGTWRCRRWGPRPTLLLASVHVLTYRTGAIAGQRAREHSPSCHVTAAQVAGSITRRTKSPSCGYEGRGSAFIAMMVAVEPRQPRRRRWRDRRRGSGGTALLA